MLASSVRRTAPEDLLPISRKRFYSKKSLYRTSIPKERYIYNSQPHDNVTNRGGNVGPRSKRDEFVVSNPATGDHMCTVEVASSSDVHHSVEAAQAAFDSGEWSRAPAQARAKVLNVLAHNLRQRISQFAEIETLQTGRAIREMTAQLGRLPEWLEYYAALLRTHQGFVAPTHGELLNYVQRVPLGVVAQITPFNHPLLIAVKKIAPALAAGNSVIVKPSELAPISVLEFAELAARSGVPPGVLTVLPGYGRQTGMDLVSHPLIRKVDITAGTATGRTIGGVVGANLAAFTAELGGKAPILVFKDTDIPTAVNGAAFAAFVASGQTCVSGTRLLVQSQIYDKFMAMFLQKVTSITRRMGNPMNPESTMGTVISADHLTHIHAMIERRKSGNILAGGVQLTGRSPLDDFDLSQGSFFAPTVIADISTDDELWKEEVFGPVVVVKRFETEREAIDLANDSRYGLGAGVWTTDVSRAHRVAAQLQSGLVWVNTHHRNDPSSPWGGMKESGIGRENGVEALESYTQSKSTIVNVASIQQTKEKDDWFADSAEDVRYG
ncbi:aldehyde dehydrogenase [Artomyces pyxidatus]|uniref:Aldehyde dehydrogenase n=1 Tax=Artomyces pyxidatus TaxID=48021 RepID=A0ACB8TBX4_9AGAM|nr:aldehyde dehydrogenase [Artomyces pyxidatus]